MVRAVLAAVAFAGACLAACSLYQGGTGQATPDAMSDDAYLPASDEGMHDVAAVAIETGTADAGVSTEAGPDADADVFDTADADDGACHIGLDETVPGLVRLTADNYRLLYVNGLLVDGTTHQWSEPTVHAVMFFRHPSRRNVVAIQADNYASLNGFDRGLLAEIDVTANDGILGSLVSDGAWRLTNTLAAYWVNPTFVDSAWAPATLEGPYGMSPWGAIANISPLAYWIWTSNSNLPSNQKVANETVYARRAFYLDMQGHLSDLPSSCP